MAHGQTMFNYLYRGTAAAETDLAAVAEQLGPRALEAAMTTAERIKAEGRVEGRIEGRVEGQTELLLKLMTAKFGPLPATVTARIHTADSAALEHLANQVLTATTLAEIFPEHTVE